MSNEDPVHIIGSFKNPANFWSKRSIMMYQDQVKRCFVGNLVVGELAGPWQVEIKVLHVAMLAVSPLHCKVRPQRKTFPEMEIWDI